MGREIILDIPPQTNTILAMIKTLDKTTVRLLQSDFIQSLQSLEAKHGIKISYKGGTFTPSNVVFRFEAAVVGADGKVENREREDFIRLASFYGLQSSWIDQTFMSQGEQFQIVGLSTRKRKNPVLCKNLSSGKSYIFPARSVAYAMQSPVSQ